MFGFVNCRVPVLLLTLAIGLNFGWAARADDVLPQAAPADRYAKMADRSPFAPPTVAVALPAATPVPAGPKWSDDLTLALLMQRGGVFFATIQNKSKNERFLLESDREDQERHLALTSVEWNDHANQTSVMLRHDTEFAAVRFDASAPVPAAVAANPLMHGMVPGSYPASAGTPLPGHFQPPPNPAGPPGVARRQMLIRSSPSVAAPPEAHSPAALPLRPLSKSDDEE